MAGSAKYPKRLRWQPIDMSARELQPPHVRARTLRRLMAGADTGLVWRVTLLEQYRSPQPHKLVLLRAQRSFQRPPLIELKRRFSRRAAIAVRLTSFQ